MERQEGIPFGEAQATVSRKSDGSYEVAIKMSDDTFDHFVTDTARKRGLSLSATIAEGIRLELLYSKTLNNPDSELYLMRGGWLRGAWPYKLVGV